MHTSDDLPGVEVAFVTGATSEVSSQSEPESSFSVRVLRNCTKSVGKVYMIDI